MFRWKPCAIVLGVILVGSLVVGCGKEKRETHRKPGPGKTVKSRVRKACEKAVADYLDALAANDYIKAVEFIDVEGMLNKRRQGAGTTSAPADAAAMKKMLRQMMQRTGERQEGELSYRIIASRVSGEEATVEVEVYRNGELADEGTYALTKRGGRWKLGGGAIRALASPIKMRPPETQLPKKPAERETRP